MLKRILMVIAGCFALIGLAFAQVDVNRADAAALDGVKGIGPVIAKRIVDERQAHGPYKDWADFEQRVKGVGDKKAAALSQAGLTVNGQAMANAPASKATKAASPAASAPSVPSASSAASQSAPSAPPAGETRASRKAARESDKAKASSATNPFNAAPGAGKSGAPARQ
jgi:DNA polymerase III alpha subunit